MNVNFSINSYNKLWEDEKSSLSETANDFLHFTESFALYENIKLVHLWLLEDPIQDLEQTRVDPFKHTFMKTFFFQTATAYCMNENVSRMT